METAPMVSPKTARTRLPSRRRGIRATLTFGAHKLHISTGEYPDGALGEIFLDFQREGSFSRDMLHAFAMAVSLGLQHGIPLVAFQRTIANLKMEPDILRELFKLLNEHYGGAGRG